MTTLSAINIEEVLYLVEAVQETVQNPEAWQNVLMLLCSFLGSASALIRFYNQDWSAVSLSVTQGFDPRFDASYRQHFVHIDPLTRGLSTFAPGRVVRMEEALSLSHLKSTEFYNDYLKPQDKYHVMGGRLCSEDGAQALFGVQRGSQQAPFTTQEKARLQLIATHLQQAFRIHQMFAEARGLANIAQQTFERLGVAVFFFDSRGRVRLSNPIANALLESRLLVTLRQSVLRAQHPSSDLVLQKLISSVAHGGSFAVACSGGAVQLASRTIRSPLVTAVVIPWSSSTGFGERLNSDIVGAVLVGPQGRPIVPAHYLAGVYRLTRTEARLVAKLIETCDLGQSAAAIGVKKQTARDYLKAVFRKTGCHSQAELIATVLSDPCGIWGGSALRPDEGEQPSELPSWVRGVLPQSR